MPPRSPKKPGHLLTSSALAKAFAVDLKTIHNWVDRDYLVATRTGGRHIRVRPADAAAFARAHDFGLPASLRAALRCVVVLDAKPTWVDKIRPTLGDAYDVVSFTDPIDALVHTASELPDVFVLDTAGLGTPLAKIADALHGQARTRGIRIVEYSAESGPTRKGVVRVGKPNLAELAAALAETPAD